MQVKSAEFETSAPTLKEAPRLEVPEFALIGRSNVGKSSLLNLLVARRDLAKVSGMPGKTRLMNFYRINRNWRLVDLPGYGYAHGSQSERADFNQAVAQYIEKRDDLRAVFVLIDSRLEPQPIDLAFLEWLVGTGIRFAVIFTKADKQSSSQTQLAVDRFVNTVLSGLDPLPEIFVTSARTKAGRSDILKYIDALL